MAGSKRSNVKVVNKYRCDDDDIFLCTRIYISVSFNGLMFAITFSVRTSSVYPLSLILFISSVEQVTTDICKYNSRQESYLKSK